MKIEIENRNLNNYLYEKSQKKKLAYVSDYSISDAENEIMELDAKVKIEKRQKEETKKIKKEEVENSIKKLPSIVESNDIETIESTIKIIKDKIKTSNAHGNWETNCLNYFNYVQLNHLFTLRNYPLSSHLL